MMKKVLKKISLFALIGLIIPSCGNPAKMAESADKVSMTCEPQVLEVVAGKINANVTVVFPNDFFHPKAVVEAIPVLVYNGGEVALDPIMLQGEKVTENYTVVPKTGATINKSLSFDYVEGMEQSRLEVRMTVIYKDKRTPFVSPYKIADGANTTYMLVKKNGALAYTKDAYQAVIPEQGEAQILYLINSATVRPTQLKSEEIKAFQDFLTKVKADERRTIKNTEVVAYASPDGKEDFNAELSAKRAETANKAFEKDINNKKVAVNTTIDTRHINEDWDGFQELVQASNIQDKELILRVLEMYSDPMVREREIKNMSQVYTTLAKEILPQLRRARFITNIEFTNYTDQELLTLVNDNIEILDEEALLHAASLVKENDSKVLVYKKAIDKYASDRAKLNLAVTYLNMDKNAEGETALNGVTNKDAYYYNTLGVIALRKGNDSDAAAAFAKSNLKEAKYNLATIDITNGKYNEAVSKLSGAGTFNEALANILVNKLDAASSILGDAQCPCKNYLKAIIAARQGKVDAAKAALAIASKEEKMAKRAQTDIEFAKIK